MRMKPQNILNLLLVLSVFSTNRLAGAEGKEKKNSSGTDELFSDAKILHVKIEIPPAGLAALKSEPRKYVKATVREGDKVYADIGLRLKGNGTFQPMEKKPSLALKFNEFTSGVKFHGHGKIFLNNSLQDGSYMSEAIGGQIFRAADVPASKVTFARVELNGRDVGLYVLAEAVNHDFLSQYFKKTKGNLYEGTNSDVTDRLEQDSGETSKDQADLKALANAAKETDPAQRWKKLGSVLDLERFISFAAVEVLTWHRDGYSMDKNNYRLYHDPASGQMVFIPHGLDQLFSKPSGALVPEWKGLVAKAVLETPDGQRRFRERIYKLLGTAFKADALHAQITQLAGTIRPGLTKESETKAFDTAVAQLKDRISQRARFLEEELKKGPATR